MGAIIGYTVLAAAIYLLSVAIRGIKYGRFDPLAILWIVVGQDLHRIRQLPTSIIFFVSRRDARTKKLLRNP